MSVQRCIQRCVHVQRRSGYRVYRNRDRRQNFVSGGSNVCIEIAVIIVGQAMAAVITAENHRVATRQRGTEESDRLKTTIRDRKSLLWENKIVNMRSCVKDLIVSFKFLYGVERCFLLFPFFFLSISSKIFSRLECRASCNIFKSIPSIQRIIDNAMQAIFISHLSIWGFLASDVTLAGYLCV